MGASSNIDVAYNSRLTLYGAIDDTTASGITKLGLGELALNGQSTYRGVTNINQGIVTVESSQALGSPVAGTVVASGATLQTQGNVTVGGEPLTLLGSGLGTAPTNVPVNWFNIGPAPENNGQTFGALPTTGRVTGIAVDPSDNNVIYIATAGGGAWKTIDHGKTWHPLFDNTSEAQVTVTGTAGNISLGFGGFTTPASGTGALAFNATADQVRTALDLLPSIGGVGGSVQVTANALSNGTATIGTIYTITYGGTLTQANVAQLTAGGSGGATVAASNVNPSMWAGAIAIDPTDPRIIYLGTGDATNDGNSFYGTGVYKSIDSGRTWSLLFDPAPLAKLPNNPIFGLAVSRIAVDPTGNGIIYVGTSDQANNAPPGLNAVPGVYRFAGSTSTWFNLTGTPSAARTSLNGQLAAPPNNPGPDDDFRLTFAQANDSWSDVSLVGGELYVAQGLPTGAPRNPNVQFPTPTTSPADPLNSNAVYRTADAATAGPLTPPVWLVGTPGVPMSETQEITLTGTAGSVNFFFPGPAPTPPKTAIFNYTGANGYDPTLITQAIQALPGIAGVKGTLTVVGTPTINPGTVTFDVVFGGQMANTAEPLITAIGAGGTTVTTTITVPGGGADDRSPAEFPTANANGPNGNIKFAVNGLAIYAAITNAKNNDILDIEKSTDGGLTWSSTLNNIGTDYMFGFGEYASTVAVDPTNVNHVIVGGYGRAPGTASPGSGPWQTIDGGTTWTSLTVDAAGNAPFVFAHASAFDGAGDVLYATDGGVYMLTPKLAWNDLDGTLANAMVVSVSPNPNDTNSALAGSFETGTFVFSGSQAWNTTDGNKSGDVQFDPQNPAIAYHGLGKNLLKSTDGGKTWNATGYPGAIANNVTFPFVVDSINDQRIVASTYTTGPNALVESFDGTATFVGLNAPFRVLAFGLATYQGNFNTDVGFPAVTDKGANTYDPNTIYITDGVSLAVTKDGGNTWKTRSATGGFKGFISSVTVDASNRDVAYATVLSFTGGPAHVWLTTNGGVKWTDITGAGAAPCPTFPCGRSSSIRATIRV